MKHSLIILSLLVSLTASTPVKKPLVVSTTYYISSAGSNSNNGTSPGTAWQTLTGSGLAAKWGSILAGDNVLLNRGETFAGPIGVGKSGTLTLPITIGAYGSGEDPIVSGFTQIFTTGTWTSLGGNRYITNGDVSSTALGTSPIEMLTIDGVDHPKGRYPNLGDETGANEDGWMEIDSHLPSSGPSTSFTDAAQPVSTTDWDGATAMIRLNHWNVDRVKINSHSGTATFNIATTYAEITDFYGWFITDPNPLISAQVNKVLDQHGEWFFDPATDKLTIYLTTDPSNYTIKVPNVVDVIVCSDDDYITLDNLNIQGANRWGTYHNSVTGNRVNNCEISNCGIDGIHTAATATINLTIDGTSVHDCNDFGMFLKGVGNGMTVKNSEVYNIGLHLQMGKPDPTQHSTAISTSTGDNHVIQNNKVHDIGYVGIRYVGANTIVRDNIVYNFCKTVDDGGGIYTGQNNTDPNKKIFGNMVFNGIGAPQGTGGAGGLGVNQAYGMYIDDGNQYYELYDNIIFNIGRTGIYLHNTANINMHDNLVYDCDDAAVFFNHNSGSYIPIDSCKFNNNILFAASSSQGMLELLTRLSTISAMPQPPGATNFNNNYYVKPIRPAGNSNMAMRTINYGGSQSVTNYTFTTWKALHGWDAASAESPIQFPSTETPQNVFYFRYNLGDVDTTVILDRGYKDVTGAVHCPGPMIIPPRSAVVLIYFAGATCVEPPPPDPPPGATGTRMLKKQGKLLIKNGKRLKKTI